MPIIGKPYATEWGTHAAEIDPAATCAWCQGHPEPPAVFINVPVVIRTAPVMAFGSAEVSVMQAAGTIHLCACCLLPFAEYIHGQAVELLESLPPGRTQPPCEPETVPDPAPATETDPEPDAALSDRELVIADEPGSIEEQVQATFLCPIYSEERAWEKETKQ